MSQVQNEPVLAHLALKSIGVSGSSPQKARRKSFNKDALHELAASIKAQGVLQPIVVRRSHELNTFEYEIVAGERRFHASIIAELTTIPAIVRKLSDEEVLEVQLIENLQRADLHPMQEAEGYQELRDVHHHHIEEIFSKVGRSKSYVYGRLKLLDLCPLAREAYYDGALSDSTALLVARIPSEELQHRALRALTEKDYNGHVMSYRRAAEHIQNNFMLKLSGAPFDREDVTLIAQAGACSACPMRTGNATDLFGDVKGADICTNPGCFKEKKAAHIKRSLEKAQANGGTVIRGPAARRILPDTRGYHWDSDGTHKQLRNGFARPRDKCLTDPKKRTYGELAGKDAPVVLLQHPDTGRIEKILKLEDVSDRLKAKGVKPPAVGKDRAEQREIDSAARDLKEEREMHARLAIFQAVYQACPPKLSHMHLASIVCSLADINYGRDDELYKLFGWAMPKGKARGRHGNEAFMGFLINLPEADLQRVALAMTVAQTCLDSYDEPKELESLATKLGVDHKKIRKELLDQVVIEKPLPAKKGLKSQKAKRKAA